MTSATLREFGLPVDIEAKQFDIPGLVAAIVRTSQSIKASSLAVNDSESHQLHQLRAKLMADSYS